MMGITDSLRVAVSGLQLAQNALATTSSNVSNVNTEGYSRKVVEQEARVLDGRGTGVRQVKIDRYVDEFLELQIRRQQAALGRSETIQSYADDVQGLVFGSPSDGTTGLGSFVDELGIAIEAAATKPDDAAQRASIAAAAENLFARIDGAADTLQVLRRDADRRIHNLVGEVNSALQAVHKINLDLTRSGDNAELMDQRDRLVSQLSYQLDVRTYQNEDGALSIFTPDGQPLLENSPRVVAYRSPALVGRGSSFPPIRVFDQSLIDPATGMPDQADFAKGRILVGQGIRATLTPEQEHLRAEALAIDPTDDRGLRAIQPTVASGELGGLLAVRDTELPELYDQLEEFGRILRHALNAAHNDANPSNPPAALEGSRTREELLAPPAGFKGSAFLQLTDGAGVSTVHEIDLDAAADVDAIVAQIDGLADVSATLNAGEGLKITAAPGYTIALAGSTTDGFRDAAEFIQDDIADPAFADHTWTFGFSHFFGLNDLVVESTSHGRLLELRADVKADPMQIASRKLDVREDPTAPGLAIATLGGRGDNRGLNALAGSLDTMLDTVARGGLPPARVTPREYLGDIVNIQAVHAATAERTAKTDRALADELGFQRAGISGVNLDEEMAHLMQLQQSYAASARLMTAADQMLDELMNIRR